MSNEREDKVELVAPETSEEVQAHAGGASEAALAREAAKEHGGEANFDPGRVATRDEAAEHEARASATAGE
jgi:hypothetical protein